MLTGRQQEIWTFLTEYVDEHGYPPTVREIGDAVGLASPSTVHAHLANLERAGLIKRDPTKPRALELRREPRSEPARAADVHRLPLVGEIAAGGPLLAEQNVEAYISVPEPLSRGGEEFLLLLPGADEEGAAQLAERVRTGLATRTIPGVPGLCVTASFGVAQYAGETNTEQLVAAADSALYRAKRAGKDRVEPTAQATF